MPAQYMSQAGITSSLRQVCIIIFVGVGQERQQKRREENQLDATERFIALIICSTCFGHVYADHQKLETILVLLPHRVYNALVAGGRRSGAGQQAMRQGEGSCSSSFPHPYCPAPDLRPPATKALYTIWGNNTSIVSSSWWREYKCPKHVEQIITAINHSVASSWCSSLRLYNDARTNICQTPAEFAMRQH